MADSNGCQVKGHVGENQELFLMFPSQERFEGNNAVVFHPHIKDELFLEPCINLVFKSLYFYYAKSKILFFHL